MAIDLGLFRLSLDQGLCELSLAQQFGWIDTAAREVTVEYSSYNGHRELWTLTRLTISWTLGGNPIVDLTTLTAPLRNLYRRSEDWVRAAFEGLYIGCFSTSSRSRLVRFARAAVMAGRSSTCARTGSR
jgi:hypothetical protein